MLNFRQLGRLSDHELGRFDILDIHLACAFLLPGSERIDSAACHKIVDVLVTQSKPFTESALAKGEKVERDDTEAKTRIRAMIEFAWRGAGIHYDRTEVPDGCKEGIEGFFIHGTLYGAGGSWATLPVLYTAMGRRLGYPLKLVETWGPKGCRLFCRWDDANGERFNIEADDTGVRFPPDDHFRRQGLSPAMEKQGLFLKSKMPREELATFLTARARLCHNLGRLRDCVDACAWAAGLSPENEFLMNMAKAWYGDWLDDIKKREPPGFPRVWVNVRQRRYPPAFPLKVEMDILDLEATDNMLRDPDSEQRFWQPLREGRAGGTRTPSDLVVESDPNEVRVTLMYGKGNRGF